MSDSLMQMFQDLRAKRPPVYLADERQQWVAALAQVVQAIPKPERRWACLVLVANDVAQSMPGCSLAVVFHSLATQLLCEEDRRPQ